ncbi:MAG: spondin domain-containing protein [Cyanobacteria bacterium J06634_6]
MKDFVGILSNAQWKLGGIAIASTIASTLVLAPVASAASIRITVDNLAPDNGTFLTPAWFGFHDGNFDLYNRNEPITPGLERLVEDGNFEPLNAEFAAAGNGSVQGAIFGPELAFAGPIDPGESTSLVVELDENAASSRYFSYASMVIPSNDFFIANGDPLAHQIFDDAGNFLGVDFTLSGAQVLDGGTEVNDELPENTAFFGQQNPDTGVTEGGGVTLATGFIPGGNILSSAEFANADFTAPGYEVARFRVELVGDDPTAVPEPGMILGLLAAGGLVAASRRRQLA